MEPVIFFENEHFIFADKPGGWLSIPARAKDKDPRPCAGTWLQETLNMQIYPVHRLDFEVSGVIVFAKNPKAHGIANSWFGKREIKKSYMALALKEEISDKWRQKPRIIWQGKILKGKKRTFESPHGDHAETHAKIIEYFNYQNNEVALWELNPITGRSHQLRFHMYKAGCPIFGDTLYNSTKVFFENEIALRAVSLDFSCCKMAQEFGLPNMITAPSNHHWEFLKI